MEACGKWSLPTSSAPDGKTWRRTSSARSLTGSGYWRKKARIRFPYSSRIATSKHSGMRELRIQHQGRPLRVLYIFDPRRTALLLLGGDKTGDERWYERNVPKADGIYDEFLAELEREG